jgi:uncharacterized protein YaeQ
MRGKLDFKDCLQLEFTELSLISHRSPKAPKVYVCLYQNAYFLKSLMLASHRSRTQKWDRVKALCWIDYTKKHLVGTQI